ncbi:MAG: cell division protein ZapA [Byssovorax sp.]
MAGRTVQLRIGGQTYRVVTTASDDELTRLAAVVDKKLATVVPAGRPVTPQAMLLAAMALAHDLEEERAKTQAVARRAHTAFGTILERVDGVLAPRGGAAPDTDEEPAALNVHGALQSLGPLGLPVGPGDGG